MLPAETGTRRLAPSAFTVVERDSYTHWRYHRRPGRDVQVEGDNLVNASGWIMLQLVFESFVETSEHLYDPRRDLGSAHGPS
jgi:hypothetical protein